MGFFILRHALFFFALLLIRVQALGQADQLSAPFREMSGIAPDIVIFKLKNPAANQYRRRAEGRHMAGRLGFESVAPMFPPLKKSGKHLRTTARSIDHIYKAILKPGQTVIEMIKALREDKAVLYAEPYYLHHLLYVPDDPHAVPDTGGQYYLKQIKAYEAWDIEQGSEEVVIGILDTGVLPDHEDLKEKIAYNKADTVNGIDDDGDGYTDNYAGWDMADGDNDPTADGSQHGTFVTGVSSASTDNGIGMAGVGFRSRFLPVKVFKTANTEIHQAYEAIVYAVDHGCDVINLSWGGYNNYSEFEQDIINYAVLEKNAVVVAAAGNDGKERNYYPASYDHVLSVGFTDGDDHKVVKSTYSPFIDLVAPGYRILTTDNAGRYRTNPTGSSVAAPMVSATAALLKARFPDLSALQIATRIRATADDVYGLEANRPYYRKMGKGRLNMARALSGETVSGIALESHHIRYDTLSGQVLVSIDLKNYLSPTSVGARAVLHSDSPYVTLVDSVFEFGAVETLGGAGNEGQPFRLILDPELTVGTESPYFLYLRIDIEDGEQWDYAYIEVKTPELRTVGFHFEGGEGLRVSEKDTVSLMATFRNFLYPTFTAKATLRPLVPGVVMIDSVFDIGSLSHLGDTTTLGQPFRLAFKEDFDFSSPSMRFELHYEDLFLDHREVLEIGVPWPPPIPVGEDWSIFPNPNEGTFQLAAHKPSGGAYVITDALGRIVFQGVMEKGQDSKNIHLVSVVPGLYFLRVEGEGGSVRLLRFVVIN